MLKVKNIKKSLIKLLFNLLDAGKFGFVEIGHIDRAYMTGYNDACEKALEWLKLNLTSITDEPFDSISVVVTDFETREQALSNFKAKLHPYSVEQIDNCIDIK